MHSFLLKTESNDREKIMSEDFWPDGIGCRGYVSFNKNSFNRQGIVT